MSIQFWQPTPESPSRLFSVAFGPARLHFALATSSITFMNPSNARGFWIALDGIAAIMVLVGVVLNFSGSVRFGTILIALSIALSGSVALKLGDLKRW